MTQGFWGKLKKPFFIMAPMADVTDAAFRRLIAKYSNHGKLEGGPDVFYTEFVSCDGLCSKGREALLTDFKYSKEEHPIVAQIFGGNPENIRDATKLCKKLGFDGIASLHFYRDNPCSDLCRQSLIFCIILSHL